MNRSIVMRRILLAPPSLRRSIFSLGTIHLRVEKPKAYATLSVTQPSFWTSLIPKPLRKGSSLKSSGKSAKPKEWNPATFFIFIFLLIGSMSVQMIALRNEFAAFSRRADAKIGLLKEIIGRIQNGEEVDVEGLLGTGDARREKEWEEVLQEIEREDQAWEQSRKPKPKHGRNLEAGKETTTTAEKASNQQESARRKAKSSTLSGFY